jgi:hypothetical protein
MPARLRVHPLLPKIRRIVQGKPDAHLIAGVSKPDRGLNSAKVAEVFLLIRSYLSVLCLA